MEELLIFFEANLAKCLYLSSKFNNILFIELNSNFTEQNRLRIDYPMSQLNDRISQFRQMTTENPDDDLGHFRLGQLLMEAGEYSEAITSFRRTLELSPEFSKAFQLLGTCLIQMGHPHEAIEILTEGWKIADERGDKFPRDEMSKLLKSLNAPIPHKQAESSSNEPNLPTGFVCQRPECFVGSRARQLEKPPFADAIGKRIHSEICSDCWNAWINGYSQNVVNDLRLDLSSEYGQEQYDHHMNLFFGFEDNNVTNSPKLEG